ncbi:MAG: 6-bladed beta-propeller [Bacteroidales bacterium]|nr:6-bladed beta-propeller [Bacteroidales bacterium]
MKKHLFYFFMMLISLTGCNAAKANPEAEEVEEGLPVINLSEDVEEVKQLNLSDAADHIEIVKLETSDRAFIKFIDKVEVTENDIFVQNSSVNVYRFSREGKYLNTIGKQGQGPGEYTWVSKHYVDAKAKEVYFLTSSNGIMVYDYEGHFLRKATALLQDQLFGSIYNQLAIYKNQFLLSRNLGMMGYGISKDSLWSIAVADEHFNKLKLFKNPAYVGIEEELVADEHRPPYIEDGTRNYWMEYNTSIDYTGDEITFKLPDTDTIYAYRPEGQKFVPEYAIHTNEVKGDYGLTHVWIKERRAFDYFSIYSYYATNNYVYLVGSKGEKVYTYAYDKRQRKVRRTERNSPIVSTNTPFIDMFGKPLLQIRRYFLLHNDITGGDYKVDYRSQGKYWVQALEIGDSSYDEFVEDLKASPDAPQKQQLLDVIAKTGEEDNPILLIAVLK